MDRHLPALDGLRGLAASIVVVSHLAQATGIWGQFFGTSGGQIGVMLFFALSGFLMAHVYLPTVCGPASLARYAIARFARVVPLFAIVVLVSYIGTATGWFRAYPIDGRSVLDHFLLRSGVSVLWTIPVELRFYAVFCAIWLAYRITGPATLAALGVILVLYYAIPPGGMPVMRLGHFFLIGILGWYVAARLSLLRDRIADALFLLAGLTLLLSFPLPFEVLRGRAQQVWWEPQIALAVALFLVSAVRSRMATRFLDTKAMRYLGNSSYSLYLTHMPVFMNLRTVIEPSAHPWLFAAVGLPIALAQAGLTWAFVERPFQNFLRRALLAKPTAPGGMPNGPVRDMPG